MKLCKYCGSKVIENSFSDKKLIILDYLKKNPNSSQMDILKHFNNFNYKNLMTARVSVSLMLQQLEDSGLVNFSIDETQRGAIAQKLYKVRKCKK